MEFDSKLPSNIDNQILRMGQAFSRVNGSYSQAEKLIGLNTSEERVLYALSVEEGVTQSDICDIYNMPKQTVNNVVRSLMSNGYVEIQADPDNRKNKPLALTQRGIDYSNEQLEPIVQLERQIRNNMGSEKYDQLVELFEAYSRAIDKAVAKLSSPTSKNSK